MRNVKKLRFDFTNSNTTGQQKNMFVCDKCRAFGDGAVFLHPPVKEISIAGSIIK